jgi:signal transduction histidine kinase
MTGSASTRAAVRFKAREVWWPATAVLAVLLIAGAFLRYPSAPGRSVIGIAVALPAVALLAGSRLARVPLGALALAAIASGGLALDAGSRASNIAWFGLCILVFGCVLTFGRVVGAALWAGVIVLFACNWLFAFADLGWLPWMVGTSVCLAAGLLLDHERMLLGELREAQAGLAERSRAEERNRIARDLHDVIAHSLTVSLLHISSARLAVEHDPADAARALAEAERLGRESLDEVRSIVGLMRSADGVDGGLAPLPGLDGVDELVARFRGAGADVDFERAGELALVPATSGTTLYRIAQEALTNAAKHAPGGAVRVRITGLPGHVELVVESEGVVAGRVPGRGSGLSTMRERAEAVGGVCEAGPCDGGWRVRATVPGRR